MSEFAWLSHPSLPPQRNQLHYPNTSWCPQMNKIFMQSPKNYKQHMGSNIHKIPVINATD